MARTEPLGDVQVHGETVDGQHLGGAGDAGTRDGAYADSTTADNNDAQVGVILRPKGGRSSEEHRVALAYEEEVRRVLLACACFGRGSRSEELASVARFLRDEGTPGPLSRD